MEAVFQPRSGGEIIFFNQSSLNLSNFYFSIIFILKDCRHHNVEGLEITNRRLALKLKKLERYLIPAVNVYLTRLPIYSPPR